MQQLTVAIEALNDAIDALNKATFELELAVRSENARLHRLTSKDQYDDERLSDCERRGQSGMGARVVYIDRVVRQSANQSDPSGYKPTSLGDII